MNKPMCVVCNKRVARFLRDNENSPYKVCKTCNALLNVEKSWANYGLRRPRSQWVSDAHFIRVYNKLAQQGMLLREIAAAMNMAEQSLKNRKVQLAKAGVQLAKAQGQVRFYIKESEPVDRSTKRSNANEHGGGKWGIIDCNCGPCLTVRRESRRLWNLAHPDKVKEFRRRAELARRKPKPL